jgi:DNA ligase-1
MTMSKNWPTLYVRTAGGAINYWHIWTEGQWVRTQWGKLGTEKPLFDEYEALGKNIGRSNETDPETQAELEAQSKFDKQLRLKYVHSVEEAKSGINIKPMRCYSLDDKRRAKMRFPVTLQPKYNGCRCMAYPPGGNETIRLMSRGGKDYVLPHIQNALAYHLTSGWCLDGELYVHGMSLQRIRSLILTPSEKTELVQFVVYDITALPPTDLTWDERQTLLYSFFANFASPYIVMSPSMLSNTLEGIEVAHDEYVRQGYEGCIIRMPHGKYKLAAKNVDILKYKKFQDAEFVVTNYTVGKDGVIVYQCVTKEGKTFEVRPQGDDAERAELLRLAFSCVGKKYTVKFQELSDDGIPIFPVGISFRGEEDMD